MPPPPLPHRSTGAPCPLSKRQLLAYERLAAGWPHDCIAAEIGLTLQGLDTLFVAGQKRIVRRSKAGAVDALMEAGWISHSTEVNGLVANYLTCWEAYAMAPLTRRDDMFVGDFYRQALHDVEHPPCSWVAGMKPHKGPVTRDERTGRALCEEHHAEFERARERRSGSVR